MKISVVIQTYNSEKFLEQVLESVKGFDEVVVCDMYSTDKTIEIAQRYHCKIVYHKKIAYCEPARNFAVQSASYEWVLVVDSDELVPEALREYLYEKISQKDCPQGIWIPRSNYFMGKFMRGAYPDYILRFFWKEGTEWPVYVHSIPQVKGKKEYIPKYRRDLAFVHLVDNQIESRIQKLNVYTDMEIPKRSRETYSLLSVFYAPIYRFLKAYVIKGGFLDGKKGFVNAGMDAFYKFITIAKIWESRLTPDDMDKELKG